ncbi:hypothetical protein CSAL01_07304 [Colletotrichum salicis]|uniref:Secreted protein n=1 Tax=Colletotrichum salicis TaxID=1209931 RepID=A0A135UHB9_9PEZI|nr:hypothetical protein CSAL01_07304 [Colletotrichum salicis]
MLLILLVASSVLFLNPKKSVTATVTSLQRRPTMTTDLGLSVVSRMSCRIQTPRRSTQPPYDDDTLDARRILTGKPHPQKSHLPLVSLSGLGLRLGLHLGQWELYWLHLRASTLPWSALVGRHKLGALASDDHHACFCCGVCLYTNGAA